MDGPHILHEHNGQLLSGNGFIRSEAIIFYPAALLPILHMVRTSWTDPHL